MITAAAGVAVYAFHYTTLLEGFSESAAPGFVVTDFERYTGLSSDDVGFDEAAATIGPQTALSTFVSYAAFLTILFLKPATRLFSSWTRPDRDRRPLVLVTALIVTFSGLLFVEEFTDYFGLTHAADPVFSTVLPALVVWVVLLSLAYRFRSLERALGIPQVTAEKSPGR